MILTPQNLAALSGGTWLGPPPRAGRLAGVGTDTRQALGGRLFVALRGHRYDGHDFLDRAVEAGAAAVMVHDAVGDALARRAGVLRVDDTRAALGRLAAGYRRRLERPTVVAVTGSAGKTTTKTMIDAVLATRLRGTAAPRSFNNDVGVPLSILDASPGDDYLVLEIGANRPGEIAQLAAIARPDVAVITTVGRAHLEGFGTLETVAREKAALLDHVAPGGFAAVNADVPLLREPAAGGRPVVLFGEAADADLRLTGRAARGAGQALDVNGSRRFELGLPGRHNALNALAAIAVAARCGLDDATIGAALAALRPVEMRLSCRVAAGIAVYNDAYNANPEAVLASVEAFGEVAGDAARRVVVLGDMHELGPGAADLHREVGRALAARDIDCFVLVGEHAACTAEPILAARPAELVTILDALDADAASRIRAQLRPGDAVLIKGSRALALERLEAVLAAAG